MKNSRQKFNWLGCAMILMTLMACSNKNPYDMFIDDYEKIVVKCEKQSRDGRLTMIEIAGITSEVIQQQRKDYRDESEDRIITPEQQKRLDKLVSRLTAISTNLASN